MRKILIIFVLCGAAWAQLATMDQIPTPKWTNQTPGDSLVFPGSVTAGNFLVVHYSGGGTFTPTIADTLLSTWTQRATVTNGSAHAYVWTATAPASGPDTVTITESGATVQVLTLAEYANVAGFDAAATGSATVSGAQTVTMPNVVTTKYRDLILDIVTMGPTFGVSFPHDSAFTPDFLAEDVTTTNETAFLQTRLSGNPGTVAGSTVTTTAGPGAGSLQIVLALTSAAALTVCTPNIPDAVQGQTYSFQLQACGGAGTNVWSITSGTLPTGLSLSSGGVISGTPSAANGNTIRFTVTDTAAATNFRDLTVHVGTSANTITRVQGASGPILNGVTAGHIILFGVMNTGAFGATYGQSVQLTDGLGSVYAPIPGATNDLVQLFWGVAGSSGNVNMTVTPALTSGFVWVSEWTNIQPIFDTGVTSKYISTTGTSPISSAAITSPVSEMLYAFASPGTVAATVTPTAPFVRDINATGGFSARQSESDYDIGAAAGSNTATWTTSGNTSNTFNMTLLGFRPTVAGIASSSAVSQSQIY